MPTGVEDVYADTVPTSADNFLPVGNKQLIQSNLSAGIHFFHVVSVDTQGCQPAGHYRCGSARIRRSLVTSDRWSTISRSR
ncbi:MAG: hypothetical protein R3B07_22845 [Polyangiaceae bacterium]